MQIEGKWLIELTAGCQPTRMLKRTMFWLGHADNKKSNWADKRIEIAISWRVRLPVCTVDTRHKRYDFFSAHISNESAFMQINAHEKKAKDPFTRSATRGKTTRATNINILIPYLEA